MEHYIKKLEEELIKGVVLDKENLDNILKKYEKSFPLAIRKKNPECDCSDSVCPHKQKLSPLFNYFFYNDISKCYKFDGDFIKDFSPLNYEIMDVINYNDPVINIKKKILYERYRIPITINKIYEPNRCTFSFLEGIELDINEDVYEQIKNKIKIIIGGSKKKIYLNKRNGKYEIFLNGEYIPIKYLNYTIIKFKFGYEKTIKAKAIYGIVNDINLENIFFDNNAVLPINNDNYLLCSQGLAGFQFND